MPRRFRALAPILKLEGQQSALWRAAAPSVLPLSRRPGRSSALPYRPLQLVGRGEVVERRVQMIMVVVIHEALDLLTSLGE